MVEDKYEVTEKITRNAHKVASLVMHYPGNSFDQTITLLQMPALDINTAIWYAVSRGWITEPDPETKISEFCWKDNAAPEGFDAAEDPAITDLETAITYGFEKLAEKENDLEEFSFSQWTTGYPAHDVVIATKNLIANDTLTEYQLEDGTEKYTFYTLTQNKDKLWGRKQFKKDPLATEK